MAEKTFHMEELMPLIRESLDAGRSVCFSPRGISMLPMLRQGRDTVTLSPIMAPLKKYDIPLYRRDDGTYVLHRIVRAGQTYTCVGDNQFALEPGLRQDQMLAVVTAFTRNGREIGVNNWLYRCYRVAWHWSRMPRWFVSRVWGRLRRLVKSFV